MEHEVEPGFLTLPCLIHVTVNAMSESCFAFAWNRAVECRAVSAACRGSCSVVERRRLGRAGWRCVVVRRVRAVAAS